jgi:hypothetical protein
MGSERILVMAAMAVTQSSVVSPISQYRRYGQTKIVVVRESAAVIKILLIILRAIKLQYMIFRQSEFRCLSLEEQDEFLKEHHDGGSPRWT